MRLRPRTTRLKFLFERAAGFLSKSEGQDAAHFDDRPADAAAVFGEPLDQSLAGQPFGLRAALGRDQILSAARPGGERGQLVGRERFLDDVALGELSLLLREQLPRFLAADSAGLAVVLDHARTLARTSFSTLAASRSIFSDSSRSSRRVAKSIAGFTRSTSAT